MIRCPLIGFAQVRSRHGFDCNFLSSDCHSRKFNHDSVMDAVLARVDQANKKRNKILLELNSKGGATLTKDENNYLQNLQPAQKPDDRGKVIIKAKRVMKVCDDVVDQFCPGVLNRQRVQAFLPDDSSSEDESEVAPRPGKVQRTDSNKAAAPHILRGNAQAAQSSVVQSKGQVARAALVMAYDAKPELNVRAALGLQPDRNFSDLQVDFGKDIEAVKAKFCEPAAQLLGLHGDNLVEKSYKISKDDTTAIQALKLCAAIGGRTSSPCGELSFSKCTQEFYDLICKRDKSVLDKAELSYCAMVDETGFLMAVSEMNEKANGEIHVAQFLRKV